MAKGKRKLPSIAARRKTFLKVLAQTANVSRALRVAKIPSSTAYAHRKRYESFRIAWDAALGEALDELETALMERALKGIEKPVFYRGEQIATVRQYSDAASMFILKARRPEIYDRGRDAPAAPAVPAADEDDVAAEFERRLRDVQSRRTALPPPAEPDEA